MGNIQFLTDELGKRTSVLMPHKNYLKIQEELEELEDLRLYDKAKKQCDRKGEEASKVFERIVSKVYKFEN